MKRYAVVLSTMFTLPIRTSVWTDFFDKIYCNDNARMGSSVLHEEKQVRVRLSSGCRHHPGKLQDSATSWVPAANLMPDLL